jgi:hypothetical protein
MSDNLIDKRVKKVRGSRKKSTESDEHRLTRDEIIIKYWKSNQLHNKFDALLLRCGLSRGTYILEDCISATFLELSRMSAEKIERLYHERPNQFEGYVMMIFKNVSIKQSNENPKGCVVSHLHHASSLNQNASIDPCERGDEDFNTIVADYNFIPVQKDDDELSIDNIFTYITDNLSDSENEILNLLLDKKKTKGRYKKDVKIRVDSLYVRFKELMLEYTNHYQYRPTVDKQFKESEL